MWNRRLKDTKTTERSICSRSDRSRARKKAIKPIHPITSDPLNRNPLKPHSKSNTDTWALMPYSIDAGTSTPLRVNSTIRTPTHCVETATCHVMWLQMINCNLMTVSITMVWQASPVHLRITRLHLGKHLRDSKSDWLNASSSRIKGARWERLPRNSGVRTWKTPTCVTWPGCMLSHSAWKRSCSTSSWTCRCDLISLSWAAKIRNNRQLKQWLQVMKSLKRNTQCWNTNTWQRSI